MINLIKKNLIAYKGLNKFKRLPSESRKIVFYAEDIQSQNYFSGLLEELLINFDEEVCYLTSDPEDTIFLIEKNHKKLNAFYIGSGIIRTWFFASLEADLLVMTMPDIETFHIKRSKIYNVHYLYIFHAMVSTHSNYRLGAFNSYDTIFCTGKQQMLEIRKTEEFYDLNKKNLYMDGYRPLEYLINENQSHNKKNISDTSVLIAPSWGKNTIIDLCIDNLLNIILKSGMQVTLRPHPMTIRNNFEKLNELKKTYRNNKNFNIQINVDNRDILFDSHILITDWSGIGMEYGLGLQKPVIYIDTPKKNNNPESNSINLIPIEVQVRSEIGSIVPISEIDNINIHISNAINSYNPDSILALRKKYVFMKEKPVYKSASRLLCIANANRSRNLNN